MSSKAWLPGQVYSCSLSHLNWLPASLARILPSKSSSCLVWPAPLELPDSVSCFLALPFFTDCCGAPN